MKALLYSLMVIAMVGGLVGGGLFAYFSDTETSTGNTFEAGTIDITLDAGDIVYENGIDAKPCETALETDVITNVGRNTLDLYKWVEIVSDPVGLADVTWYDLTVGTTELIPDGTVTLGEKAGQWIPLGPLGPGESVTVIQSFHIKMDADNTYQGAVIELSKSFYGIQAGGPVPTDPPTP
jgi:predicted ribosomally synthesized peptide with SipW-like signal peptide